MDSFKGDYTFATLAFLRNDWSPEEFGPEISLYSRPDKTIIFRGKTDLLPDGFSDAFHVQAVVTDSATFIVIKEFGGNAPEYEMSSKEFGSILDDSDGNEENLAEAKTWIVNHIKSYFANTDEFDSADDLAFLILKNHSKPDMEDGMWLDILDGEWIGSYGEEDQIHVDDDSFAGAVFVDAITTFDVTGSFSETNGFDFDGDPDRDHDESTRLVAVGK